MENEILNAFKHTDFVQKVIKVNSTHDFKALCNEYNLNFSDDELLEFKKIVEEIKHSATKKKLEPDSLDNVVCGKGSKTEKIIKDIGYLASRPTYYTSLAIAKSPIIGIIAYHCIKDAIMGMYDALRD